MIYFYYGTDRERIQKTARAAFNSLQKKKPDASFVSFDVETLTESDLHEITASQGLFEKKIVAKLSDIFDDKEKAEFVLKYLKQMKETENIIVWSEGTLTKANSDKIKKYAEKMEELGAKEAAAKKTSSIFAFTDALGDKDKKTAWMLLLKEFKKGTVKEEIHGTIFWQVKAMLLSKKLNTASEADLNPFVFSKAKTFAKKWELDELNNAVKDLTDMYHKSHRGEVDFETELERWVLGV